MQVCLNKERFQSFSNDFLKKKKKIPENSEKK